jgi:hypothetical protein
LGTSRANRQWLKRGVLALALLGLHALPSCKHRRGPSIPEEWDPAGLDASTTNLQALLPQTTRIHVQELIEDGYVTTDTLTWSLDLTTASLKVERKFDPVPFTPEDPILVEKTSSFSAAAQNELRQYLSTTRVRQVPRCNPYGAIDGGYGGRFLILVDRSGQEHRFGATDANCAASDHECSGACLSTEAMNHAVTAFSVVLPMPEKPQTVFSCAADSPLPCSLAEFSIHGAWEGTTLRADIRRVLTQRFCSLAAFSLEPASEGHWLVQSSSRETIGTVRFNTLNRTVSCLTRSP